MSGMPARSAAVRSAVMFSMHSRRRASAPGMSNRFTHDARGVEAHGVADGVVDDVAEGRARRLLAVDVGDVDAQHEGGLLAAGERLQQRRLAERELDRVGAGRRPASRSRAAMSSMPARKRGSPKKPWSTATSMQRPERGVEEAVQAVGGGHAPIIGTAAAGAARGRITAAVVIAGPNLTIDRTLSIDELRPGEVLRFERAVVTPGGKGVNVARVARDLGADAVLVGFVPGRTGAAGAALLADEGLVVRGVEVGGELRSTAVVLERSGRVTVLNEPGPPLAPGDWELYEARAWPTRWRASACWRAADRCRRARRPTPTGGWSALAHARGRGGGRRRRRRAAGGGGGAPAPTW